MKNTKSLKRIGALLCALMLCLSGCGGKKNLPEPTKDEATALIDAYLEYERYTVYGSYTIEADWEHPVDVKGRAHRFSKVTDSRFNTWKEWTEFAESIFCGKYLIQIFNEQTNFVNIDGFTYCFGVRTDWTLSEDYTYEITHTKKGATVLELRRGDDGEDSWDMIHSDYFLLSETASGWRIAGLTEPEPEAGKPNP